MKIHMNNEAKLSTTDIRRQRGAALITVLMLSTLLLATGGTLILVTSLSTKTALDATAEMQAYYSAEAGMQDTLNALRGNVAPEASMPAGSKISFRNAVTPGTSNRPSDRHATAHLSGWLNYDYTSADASSPDRVALTPSYSPINGLAYSVEVSDPDNIPVANGEPDRLLLHVTGYGPKGATKLMELVVKRTFFDYSPPAMLMIRGADNGAPAHFTAGDSNTKDYTGHDHASPSVLPAFGATSSGDETIELNADTKDTVASPKAATIPISSLPDYLQTTDGPYGARAFLDDPITGQKANAITQHRYFTSYSGSPTGFTFVDGDCTLDGGSGLLIVTGTLTLNGNPSFDGLVLVLGEGHVQRSGGGSGIFYGAMAVARFNRGGGNFLAPFFDTDGGGNSTMQYDSNALRRALNASGPRVMGIHEY